MILICCFYDELVFFNTNSKHKIKFLFVQIIFFINFNKLIEKNLEE